MIYRVAYKARHSVHERFEFLIIARIPGYKALGYTARTHGAPFVVVAIKPDLSYIFELSVLRYVLRAHVAMIIDYRHSRSVVVIKKFGKIAVKQKIVFHKIFHFCLLFSALLRRQSSNFTYLNKLYTKYLLIATHFAM